MGTELQHMDKEVHCAVTYTISLIILVFFKLLSQVNVDYSLAQMNP